MQKQLKIKVCGMRDQENILRIAACNPDYLGFIFYPKSKRYVGEKIDVGYLPKQVQKVGVFVYRLDWAGGDVVGADEGHDDERCE